MTPSSPAAADARRAPGAKRGGRRRRRGWWLLLAVVVVAAPLIAPTFVLPREKARVLGRLSGLLGRSVSADALRLRLLPWPAFELDNVRLGEAPAFGLEDMASADDVVATPRLAPLLRGRLVFSSIRLDDADVNLTRDGAGAWNLAELLDHAAAAGARLRPTGARAAASAPAPFPYLELRQGRINFKFGQFKRAFYLDNVSGALVLSPRFWSLRLRFDPERTDMNLSGVGEVTVDARWRRGSGGFRALPFDLSAHVRDSYLAALAPLLLGRDPGARGLLAADLRAQGTAEDFRISGEANAESLRRWDELPGELAGGVKFQARYLAAADELQLLQAGDDQGRWLVSGDVTDLLTRPRADLTLALRDLPAAGAYALLAAADPKLPAATRVEGELRGGLHAVLVSGQAPQWLAATLRADPLTLEDERGELRLTQARCDWIRGAGRKGAGGELRCGEGGAALLDSRPGESLASDAAGTALTLTASANAAGAAASLLAPRLSARAAAELSDLLGLPAIWPAPLRGAAAVEARVSAPWPTLAAGFAPTRTLGGATPAPRWTAQASWSAATWGNDFPPRSLPLRGVTWRRAGDGVERMAGTATLGGAAWTFSLLRSAPGTGTAKATATSGPNGNAGAAAIDGPPLWTFSVRAGKVSAAALLAELRPRPEGFFSFLSAPPATAAGWLARARGQGAIHIARLTTAAGAPSVDLSVSADAGAPENAERIASITARWPDGGEFRGTGEMRGGVLEIAGRTQNLALAPLLAGTSLAGALRRENDGEVTVRVPLAAWLERSGGTKETPAPAPSRRAVSGGKVAAP